MFSYETNLCKYTVYKYFDLEVTLGVTRREKKLKRKRSCRKKKESGKFSWKCIHIYIYIHSRLEAINQTKKSLPRSQIHGYVFHNYTRVYFHMSCPCILKRLKYRPDTLCAPVRPEFSCNFVDISKNGRCYVLRNFFFPRVFYFFFFSILKIILFKTPVFTFLI